jgi:hypothetical protein
MPLKQSISHPWLKKKDIWNKAGIEMELSQPDKGQIQKTYHWHLTTDAEKWMLPPLTQE